MTMKSMIGSLLVVASAGMIYTVAWTGAQPAALDAARFRELGVFIRPDEQELAWRKIPWRTSLAEGMEEARRLNRPILLWTMNGHPMACT